MTTSIRSSITLVLATVLVTFAFVAVPSHARSQQQTSAPQAETSATSTLKAPRPNPDAEGKYHVGDGVTAPILIYSVEPSFSEAARKRKLWGKVRTQFIVEMDGSVSNLRVIRSAGEDFKNPKDQKAAATLDEEAIKAVRQYRFKPSTFQGKPVPVELTVEVNFGVF